MQCVLTREKSPLLSNTICCVTSQAWGGVYESLVKQSGHLLTTAARMPWQSSLDYTPALGLKTHWETWLERLSRGFVKGEAGTLVPLLWRLFKPLYFIKQQGEAYLYFKDIWNRSSQIQSEVVCLSLSLRLSLWQLNLRAVSAIKKTSEFIFTDCLDLMSNIFYNPRLVLIHLWKPGSSITLNHYWCVEESSRTPCTVWVLILSCVHPLQTLNLKRRVQPNIQILSSFNSIEQKKILSSMFKLLIPIQWK